ncbi:hypothetical protein Anapl_06088 [Anas platyrhynchos]|uniref:Uncharacterized protein n=1 Tax=Anas platyrhynchos TaxID=8839 RepID=R0L9B6_ANAPL|nr:hypothetical protein Anapl_06088 [Anas platyrhynchos]
MVKQEEKTQESRDEDTQGLKDTQEPKDGGGDEIPKVVCSIQVGCLFPERTPRLFQYGLMGGRSIPCSPPSSQQQRVPPRRETELRKGALLTPGAPGERARSSRSGAGSLAGYQKKLPKRTNVEMLGAGKR